MMHWRAHSDQMDNFTAYDDVVSEVASHLQWRVSAAVEAGINVNDVIIDPGLGFAKESKHNWQILRNLDRLIGLGHPVLVAASRKRFLGSALADPQGRPRAIDQRDGGSAAVAALATAAGVWGVRVHDVAEMRTLVDALDAL